MPSPAKTKAKNASWLVFERAVGVAIGFFVMTIVARHLGPAGFGAYTYLFGLVALFAPLAGFGLSEITMRHVAADPDNAHAMLGAALVIQAGGALVGAGLAILSVAAFGGPAGVTTLLIAVASLRLLAQPGEVFNAWFTARERMGWVVVPRILAALAIAAATLMLVLREAGLDAFVSMSELRLRRRPPNRRPWDGPPLRLTLMWDRAGCVVALPGHPEPHAVRRALDRHGGAETVPVHRRPPRSLMHAFQHVFESTHRAVSDRWMPLYAAAVACWERARRSGEDPLTSMLAATVARTTHPFRQIRPREAAEWPNLEDWRTDAPAEDHPPSQAISTPH